MWQRSSRRVARCAAVGVATLVVGLAARAEPSPRELAAARQAFAEARRAENAGDWEGALERLRVVASVRMTPQVRFHLALCDEALGRLVAARDGFTLARDEASARRLDVVVRESEQHLAGLRERLAIAVPAEVADARVSVAVADPPVAPAAMPAPPAEAVVAPRVAPAPAAAAPVAAPSRAVPWALVAGGGGLLATAGVFALLRSGHLSTIEQSCPSHLDCDPALRSDVSSARTFGALGVGFGVAGGVALGSGLLLLASSSERPGTSWEPLLAPGLAGVAARGAF